MYVQPKPHPVAETESIPETVLDDDSQYVEESGSEATAMHPGVFLVTTFGWLLLIAAYWWIFAANAEALFMVGVSTIFALVYFGLATMLLGLDRAEGDRDGSSFSGFMTAGINTLTGHMTGAAALIQVASVPLALGAGTVAMAAIIAISR